MTTPPTHLNLTATSTTATGYVNYRESPVVTILTYVMLGMSPFIIFLNILVICSVVIVRELHKSQDILLANQAVCDLLVGAISVPCIYMALQPEIHQDVMGKYMYVCIITINTILFPTLSVMLSMMVLTLDRYLAIVHPYTYFEHEKDIMKGAIVAMWTYVLFGFVIPFFWNNWDDTLDVQGCFLDTILPDAYYLPFVISIVGLTILPPVYMNVRIFYTVKKAYEKNRSSTHTFGRVMSKAVKTKWYITMVIYVFNFALWVPYIVSGIIDSSLKTPGSLTVTVACLTASVASSALNPLVYASLKVTHKHAYKMLLTTPMWNWRHIRHRSIQQNSAMMTPSRRTSRMTVTVMGSEQVFAPSISQQTSGDLPDLSDENISMLSINKGTSVDSTNEHVEKTSSINNAEQMTVSNIKRPSKYDTAVRYIKKVVFAEEDDEVDASSSGPMKSDRGLAIVEHVLFEFLDSNFRDRARKESVV